MAEHLYGRNVHEVVHLRAEEPGGRGIGEDAAQLPVLALSCPAEAHDPVDRMVDEGAQQFFVLAHFALRSFDVAHIAEHQDVAAARRRAARIDFGDLHMQEATRTGHHFLRLAGVENLVNLDRARAEEFLEWRAQCLGLGHGQHLLCRVIEADHAILVVDDDDGILHRLENGFVGERAELDNLLTDNQPGIDR